MADHAKRLRIALVGGAATVAVTVAGFVVVGVVSIWRCGGFFGESSAVPGTLSQSLCREGGGRIAFAVIVLVPMVTGLAGTAAAAASGEMRRLRLPLAVSAAVPVVTALLYLFSGSL